MSEIGRTPKLTSAGGRDHWTFTSAMLIGSGVAGGRAIGGYEGYGVEVDLETGEPGDTGVGITAANLGATILTLGDVDPGADAPVLAAAG